MTQNINDKKTESYFQTLFKLPKNILILLFFYTIYINKHKKNIHE